VKLSNSMYDRLKFMALVTLPALTSLYFGVAQLWKWPNVAAVVGTMTLLDTFIGSLVGVSNRSYSPPLDGNIHVDKTDPAKDVYSIEMHTPLPEIDKKDSILLKVVPAKAA
jgi:hypothetical protein